jgi:hypothetical protein
MRKLLPIIPLLFIAAACQKDPGTPFASATFDRTIDNSDLWTWAYSNKTAGNLSFTQSYYTGSLTSSKISRWRVGISPADTGTSLFFTFPGADSSTNPPMGKEMFFATRVTDNTASLVNCTYVENKTVYTGIDSTFIGITIEDISYGLITGTFSIKLYSPTATVIITEGHFTKVPMTLQ